MTVDLGYAVSVEIVPTKGHGNTDVPPVYCCLHYSLG